MSIKVLVGSFLRVFAVWLFYEGLVSIFGIIYAAGMNRNEFGWQAIVADIIATVLILLLSVLIWVKTDWLSNKIIPSMPESTGGSAAVVVKIENILPVVGLVFIVCGLKGLVVVGAKRFLTPAELMNVGSTMADRFYASDYLLELIIGLFLIKYSAFISRKLKSDSD